MSIPCNNRIICRCENNATLEKIKNWVDKNHPNFIDFDTNEEDTLSFNLDHDYGFPAKIMQQMTCGVGPEDALQISVLTSDHSQEYIAHHHYEQNMWHLRYESCEHPLCERLTI